MAVRIRLKRMGNKNRPFYRVVVADSRSPRDGRFLETLGHYNPLKDPAEYDINEERTLHWLQNGAGMSETARSLLKKSGLLARFQDAKAELKKKRQLQKKGELPADDASARMTPAEVIAAEAAALRASEPAPEAAAAEAAPAEAASAEATDEA